MSEIKNGGLDQYGVEPFEQQQFGTAGVERVKSESRLLQRHLHCEAQRPARLVGTDVSRIWMLHRESTLRKKFQRASTPTLFKTEYRTGKITQCAEC